MFQTKEAQSLRILNTIFFVLMILANILVESLPLNNITTAQVSTRNDTILTPTGITFAIWGVIYVWLFLFILYQNGIFLKKGEGDNPDIVHAVSIFFIVSSALNIAWLIAWHYEYVTLCFILIFAMWVTLLFAHGRLLKEMSNRRQRFFARIPFSIYLAWISVAMALNFIAMLKHEVPDLLGISETVWGAALVIIIFFLSEFFLMRYRDYAFTLTILWALSGILYRYAVELSKQTLQVNLLLMLAVAMGVLIISLLISIGVQRLKT